MIWKILTVVILMGCVVGAISCGSSSNEKKFCEALMNSIYTACDLTDPADQAILIPAFYELGEDLTAEELENLSEGEAVAECTTNVESEDVRITDQQTEAAILTIEAIPTTDCTTTVNALTHLIGEME